MKNSKPMLTSFNFLSWGTYQKGYSESAAKIKDSQWDEIISSAWALSKASCKLPTSADLIIDKNNKIQDFNPCTKIQTANRNKVGTPNTNLRVLYFSPYSACPSFNWGLSLWVRICSMFNHHFWIYHMDYYSLANPSHHCTLQFMFAIHSFY